MVSKAASPIQQGSRQSSEQDSSQASEQDSGQGASTLSGRGLREWTPVAGPCPMAGCRGHLAKCELVGHPAFSCGRCGWAAVYAAGWLGRQGCRHPGPGHFVADASLLFGRESYSCVVVARDAAGQRLCGKRLVVGALGGFLNGKASGPMLSTMQAVVLSLAEHPGQTVGMLALRTGLSEGQVQGSLKRLRRRGIVQRHAAVTVPMGRRCWLHKLTEGVGAAYGTWFGYSGGKGGAA